MATAQQTFHEEYGQARASLVGEGAGVFTFLDHHSRPCYEIRSSVHSPYVNPAVWLVLSMRTWPNMKSLTERLAAYKSHKAWLRGEDDSDDYIDD